MKTSNKILIGFFIVVFLIPVIILMSFTSKIKNGKFTVVDNEFSGYNNNYHRGAIKPYKVVKVVSPVGRPLKFSVQYSDSAHYSYSTSASTDSVTIYNTGDTLLVQYKGSGSKTPDGDYYQGDDLFVKLNLSILEHLILDNAEGTIFSVDTAHINRLSVEIYNNGLFNMGVTEQSSENAAEHKFPYKFEQLYVKSVNGKILLGKSVDIGQLNMDINGNSSVTIEEGALIGEVKGNLSDSSTVKANWKYLKKLLPLTN